MAVLDKLNAVPRPSVSVVLCAYTEDRWDQLIAAVDSIAGQSLQANETIVVIDHNPPLLAKAAARFPRALVLPNSQTPGLSGARNTGLGVARGTIVAFLDDDAVAAPDWLERLWAGYRAPGVIGVGGSIVPDWHPGRPAWFPPEFDWVVGCTYKGMPERISPVRNLIGANMSFRRDKLAQLGGFRLEMGRVGTSPVGCEETELCIRAQQRWPDEVLLYNPAASVRHHVPHLRANVAYFRSRCYAEGLSKAQVSRLAGRRDGLASEVAYTFRVLTRGVARGLGDFLLSRDATGLSRATAIVAGLAWTTAGYLAGTLSLARAANPEGSGARSKEMRGRSV